MAVSREPRRNTNQDPRQAPLPQADPRKAGLAQPLWVDRRSALGGRGAAR